MSTALYRRYRPDSFADVIGQEHVTGPLMQALRSNRVNHAYLFSGPRGCGKTTSARILARILNCHENTEQAPRDTPCGVCPSCVDLATGAAGSLDVVEIDAASHGGVDDARELRERATFSPSRDRFKIFILDEAHMVTPQGFNALLKIVEEPPEYLKFIFATTEPDKVIGTIRSRTHHYPFRLIPPDVLAPYVEQLCQQEGVQVGGGVMPLVVRAGGGSARDTLSVMDQLIAGSEGGTVDYELAVALLGYTHATLLDDVVDGLAARDGGSIFRVVDRVIDSGHEPRRFVEDLLERLRDLIVIAVSGEGATSVLRGLPSDQMERMRLQATNLGLSELSRAADLANGALTEMSGATSPRLHLELLCARLLLPAADDSMVGVGARLDRLERGLSAGATETPDGRAAPRSAAAPAAPAPSVDQPAPAGAPALHAPATAGRGAAAARQALAAAGGRTSTAEPAPAESAPVQPAPNEPAPSAVPTRSTAPAEPSDEQLPPWDIEPPQEEPAPSHPEHATEAVTRREPVVVVDGEPELVAERAAQVVAERTVEVVAEPTAQVVAEPTAEPDVVVQPEPHAELQPEPECIAARELEPAVEPGNGAARGPEPVVERASEVEQEPAARSVPVPAAAASAAGTAEHASAAAVTVQESEMLRRRWPEVLETLSSLKRATWVLVKDNAQVAELNASTLRLTFGSTGLATTFRNGPHAQLVQQAVHETLGFEVKVEGGVDEGRPAARESAGVPPEEPDPGPHDPFETEPVHAHESSHPYEPAHPREAPSPHVPSQSRAAVHPHEPVQAREPAHPRDHAEAERPTRGPSAAPATTDSAAAVTAPRDLGGPVTDWEVVPVGSYDPTADASSSAPRGDRATATSALLAAAAPAPLTTAAAPAAVAPIAAAVTRTPTVASPEVPPVAVTELPGQHLTGAQAAKAALAARQAGAYGNTRAAASASAADDAIPESDTPLDYDEEPPYAEDSVDFSETALMGVPLVAQLLGAKVITEIVEGQA